MRKNLDKFIDLPKIDPQLFSWLNWNAGSIHDLDLKCRYSDINSKGKTILKLYAIGWCYGEELICRNKINEIALMCNKDDKEFWFHIRVHEFIEVFRKE